MSQLLPSYVVDADEKLDELVLFYKKNLPQSWQFHDKLKLWQEKWTNLDEVRGADAKPTDLEITLEQCSVFLQILEHH